MVFFFFYKMTPVLLQGALCVCVCVCGGGGGGVLCSTLLQFWFFDGILAL